MTDWLTAAAAICMRDLRIFLSYRMRFLSTLLTPIVGVTLFYYVSRLINSPQVGSPDEYFGYVVVGTVILQVLTSTLTAPVGTLRAELMVGTFERLAVSPFGPVATLVALSIFPMILGLTVAFVTLTYAALVFGLALDWPSTIAGLPIALLGALSFAPFGLLMAASALSFKQTNAGPTLVVAGLSLVAGLYFPPELLPSWIRWLSDVQPFTPAANLLRHLLLGTPMSGSELSALLKLIGFALVMLPIAAFVLNASVQYSRRKGTITEY
jgi:ABC-2 type transport system permease protein